jgi:hypothetical protein
VRVLVIPGHWAVGVDRTEYEAAQLEARGGRASFTFGGRAFLYDRLGLQPAGRQSTEVVDDGP